MFGIIKAIMMTLALSGSPAENIAINTDNPYVGTWEWEKTTVKGRGGENTTDPSTANITRQIIITADHKVQVLENGKITCEGDFTISGSDDNEDDRDLNDSIDEGCMKGIVGVIDGQLQHYVYLGCPSSTSYYNKAK